MLDFTNYEDIPEHTQYSLKMYVEEGYFPGGFLLAVLSNDLMGAFGRADSENLEAMPQIVRFIYNRTPCDCWGSVEKVGKFLEGRVYDRLGRATEDFVHGD